ncbi:MAG: MFS transporter [Gemmatimonadota bacterium]|nr:MFS transporter [Gemmatimonadota bacterium]
MQDRPRQPQVSPLTRLLQRGATIEPGETASVVTAFLLFFCVMSGYFAVRPVRETVGTILGAERTADLFVATWIASIAIVPIYGWLCARFRRSVFLPWIYGFVALALATVGVVLRGAGDSVHAAQFFFVFISVLNLFVVSVFWSFLLELFDAGQTKRLFGVIAAGGTAGALVGPLLTSIIVVQVGNAGILFLGAALFGGAIVCQRLLIRIWEQSDSATGPDGAPRDAPLGGNPFAGFSLILKSPYLMGIALFVVFGATANTFLYFAQLRIVSDTFADPAIRTRVFGQLDFTVQSLTFIAQIVFTGRIASKFGIGALLTAVPLAVATGFLFLSGAQSFAILAAVMITRRVGEYSFVRPGREMLFSRVDTETKYKAKNAIDVPVYRGGDALVAQVDSALSGAGMAPTGIALFGAGAAVAWAVNGLLLGRAKRDVEARARAETAGAAT